MTVDGVAAFKRLVKWLGITGVSLFAGGFIVTYLTHLFWVIATFTPIGFILMLIAAALALIYYLAIFITSLACKYRCNAQTCTQQAM